ncbi:hypothetical protein QAD02_015500 [Eretmocerus hayati]|uniref:Uncharacterized protein n=1 Tax=Eretmocerus hayati TaxID=131215 RepID=A0ACC2P9E9_9HYME|nr:hypothetical protein QAD02_015500 [Eretmocerus hayati]
MTSSTASPSSSIVTSSTTSSTTSTPVEFTAFGSDPVTEPSSLGSSSFSSDAEVTTMTNLDNANSLTSLGIFTPQGNNNLGSYDYASPTVPFSDSGFQESTTVPQDFNTDSISTDSYSSTLPTASPVPSVGTVAATGPFQDTYSIMSGSSISTPMIVQSSTVASTYSDIKPEVVAETTYDSSPSSYGSTESDFTTIAPVPYPSTAVTSTASNDPYTGSSSGQSSSAISYDYPSPTSPLLLPTSSTTTESVTPFLTSTQSVETTSSGLTPLISSTSPISTTIESSVVAPSTPQSTSLVPIVSSKVPSSTSVLVSTSAPQSTVPTQSSPVSTPTTTTIGYSSTVAPSSPTSPLTSTMSSPSPFTYSSTVPSTYKPTAISQAAPSYNYPIPSSPTLTPNNYSPSPRPTSSQARPRPTRPRPMITPPKIQPLRPTPAPNRLYLPPARPAPQYLPPMQ